ncbi:hypothetical protein ABWH74_001764 [Burkholderia vietnamiensis]|jgi:hypothetical protein|uniref:Uncharacterized protein n=1 Tax=Burkholderia ubonensis TaxID=101571 RepID=A0A1B4LMQ1_9BURK|nr:MULTISPECIES: hypothetical protein [Burkholderia]AOJ78438.1 hypothetical protein WJ35_25960 [Burkholderia ubonensis]AOK12261.1 hypothetical protein WK31_18365 [Burkholderia vietnamiensis]KVF04913.1 hypothetical protein WJ05_29490 [Burkholderia vietnamiensis]MBH9642413.1 hypothetical protein [Burkholderia vietnamiensis]MBR7908108.1 hypothetical protein [Burkholderia vietnamiensis]
MATVRPTPPVAAPDARTPERRRAAVASDRPRLPKATPWPSRRGEWPTHCPLCFGALEPLPGAGGYARHRSARCSAQCVLTTRQYQPDELAIRGSSDVEVAARHRERFVARWACHYASMRHVWPALTIERFIAVIACADVADLWSYRMLRDDDLAAVLLVLAGFMRVPEVVGGDAVRADTAAGDVACAVARFADAPSAVTSSAVARCADAPSADTPSADTPPAVARGAAALAPTARWVRFWFDASVRDVGDLWTAGGDAPRLFRVDYREPVVTPYPTGAQVLAWQPIDGMRDLWVQCADAREPAVGAAERAAFARFLAQPAACAVRA